MVMYVNEFNTKEKPKLTEIKINCNISQEKITDSHFWIF